MYNLNYIQCFLYCCYLNKTVEIFKYIFLEESEYMKCPFCSSSDTKVVDTRTMEDNTVIRRRRSCDLCGMRFTTYERMERVPLIVKKSNNMREPFDRNKLLKGIILSCNKRPVSVEQMEAIVDEIENVISMSNFKEIESKKIGLIVMEKLKELDEVAYVRFVSVYRQFNDIESFVEELNMLKEKKKIEN